MLFVKDLLDFFECEKQVFMQSCSAGGQNKEEKQILELVYRGSCRNDSRLTKIQIVHFESCCFTFTLFE